MYEAIGVTAKFAKLGESAVDTMFEIAMGAVATTDIGVPGLLMSDCGVMVASR
jgi:hypothetical protein